MKIFFSDLGGFRYAADEPVGGSSPAAAPATPAASAPAPSTTSTPSPAAPAAGQTTTVPAASSSSGSAATPASSGGAPATSAPQASWLDGFRAAGYQTQETDESRVRAQLIQDARDAQQLRGLAPLATEYQQHQQEFQEYLKQTWQKKQDAAPEDWTKQLGWNPPEYDPTWVTQLKRNEDGSIVALPGAPADLPMKYQRYQQWRQAEVDKFIGNPFKYMEPAIKHLAGQIAAEQAQSNVGSYKDQVEAQGFIQQHSDWLFENDSVTGGARQQSRFNAQTGKYDTQKVLSGNGKLFVERMQDYQRQGLSPQQQQQFAFNDVRIAYMSSPEYQNYLLSQRTAPAAEPVGGAAPAVPAPTARQQANASFTQKTNPATPPAPSAGGNAVPAPQKVTRDNMADILLKRMREQGVTIE